MGVVSSDLSLEAQVNAPKGVTPLPPLGAVTSVSLLQNHWCPHGGAGGGGAVTNNNPSDHKLLKEYKLCKKNIPY